MVKGSHILIVDDSPSDLQLTAALLDDLYSVVTASSGREAIRMISSGEISPVVILLDASMPEMDGYATCREIKKLDNTQLTDILFLSGHNTIADKMLGYDAGASDFLSKPMLPVELIEKVKLAMQRYTEKLDFEEQSRMAMETAMAAIMDSSEQATVIHFMRSCLSCNNVEDLANLITEATVSYGLTNTIELRLPWRKYHASSTGSVSPLEVELLDVMQDIGKISQLGKRLILNFGGVSQFIRNMPEDDTEKCGRLRDHLALILEAANSRLQSLILSGELKHLIVETNDAVESFNSRQATQKQANVDIMDEMHGEIQEHFFTYGLTEEQETVLLTIINKYSEKIFDSYENGLQLDTELMVITSRLKSAVDRML